MVATTRRTAGEDAARRQFQARAFPRSWPRGGDVQIAAATAQLTLGTSSADIVGATIAIDTPGIYLILGVFDFEVTVSGVGQCLGELSVGGSVQAALAIYQLPTTTGRETVVQQWRIDITTPGTIVKLRARKTVAAGTAFAQPSNTQIAAATGIAGGSGGGGGGGVTFGVPTGNIDIGDAAAEGASANATRADHQHQFSAPAGGYPVDVADTEADGSGTDPARSDHKHKLGILTTKGDLLGYSTLPARVPIGANNEIWVADSTPALGGRYDGDARKVVVMTLIDNTIAADRAMLNSYELLTISCDTLVVAFRSAISGGGTRKYRFFKDGVSVGDVTISSGASRASATVTAFTLTTTNVLTIDRIATSDAGDASTTGGVGQAMVRGI